MPEEIDNQPKDVLPSEDLGAADIASVLEKKPQKEFVDGAIEVFEKTYEEANDKYGEQVRLLSQQSLTFLDKVADKALDPKEGKTKSLLKQTALGVIGIPGNYSVGDILGVLRGYRNLRQGNTLKGVLELVTALIPGVPTPPFHAAIEKWVPDAEKPIINKT